MASEPAAASLHKPGRSLQMRVRRFIVEHRLVEAGERVLVGVSGGPDSTCLLVTLAALQRSLGIDLHAGYFDHGLRGKRAAAREERFVRSLAGELDVPLHCGSGDVRAHAASKRRSIEEAARELRYRFFARITASTGCGAVATGHTKDDQAETVLLHLVRGSGLRGLAAMSPSSSWPGPWPQRATDPPRLIRPLLAVTREETEACCRQAAIEPIQDPSNRSRAHLRNRIRSELTPLLRRYNPRIDDALARLAESAAADIELLEALAADVLTPDETTAGPIRIARKRLASLPESLQRHAVRLAAARALGDARGLSDRHVRAILRAAAGPTGARLDLPRGLRAQVTRSSVVLSTGEPSTPAPLPQGMVTLAVPGTARFGPWRFQAQLTRRPAGDLSKSGDANVALLDASACGRSLELRRRRRGDRFHPLGMPGQKKLQDYFIDAHVPRAERDAVPLVCGDQGIAWVVTQRPAEWAKVTEKTRRVLRIRATLSPP